MNETLNLLGLATTPLELLSFALSIATVWLNIRQNHWAWLFAILSSALYGAVFYESKLYGDMGLQLVFIAVSVWGWYQWLRGDDSHERLPVTALAWRGRAVAAVAWLVLFAGLAWFLKSNTDTDVPFADGFLTAGSLVGQVLLSRKKLENWHTWIIVDVLYVALYVHKGLMLTAVLYAMFVVMAIIGLLAWRKSMAGDEEANAASAAMVLK
ncbi:nicotinamide mononucleotide transporter [Pseudoduganella flava]|uniref:Nicotinamide riboside transporter PnuC n=1 Tax=Pseudoduganella flava TaxID=871742 RepID=A0A562PEM1_9BURK|nr:nicotinamide riboside transporter PnuC [Pseudoduganella flava]QGZ38801.1 nicotinamide riboside transporter PnuC [Pseudoduganella flava]TWI42858.1 nicotinamide mononucleotide transporter [Pseudoduganella flava]